MTDRDENLYFLGGRPLVVPEPPAPKRAVRAEPRRELPTYWKMTAAKFPILVNPNTCMVCHKAPHGPTPHHAFLADEAFAATAKAMGWPLPAPPELPL